MKQNHRISGAASVSIALVILVIVALWFFSGIIKVDCDDTSVKIKASYWADLEINYSDIDTVTYRNNIDAGERTAGVGSARLSVGRFQNDEFGSYTLYAYTDSTEYIVLISDGKTFVIGMRNAADTQTVYDTILERMGEK